MSLLSPPHLPLVSSQLLFDMDKEIFPMVIQAVVAEGEGESWVDQLLLEVTLHNLMTAIF